jgi:hypothetical protein
VNDLHKKLLVAFQSATHQGLTDDQAVEALNKLHDLLELWTRAMKYAVSGDMLATSTTLSRADETSKAADEKDHFPRYVAVVRHRDLGL